MKRLISSFSYAFRGIYKVLKTEQNFRLHCLIAFLVVLLGITLHWNLLKWILAIIAMTMVLFAEMVNTAIEYTWNHLEPNHHPMAGTIKDIMAGSVLVVSIGAALVGLILVFN